MMNPFEEKPKSIKNYPMDWKTLYAAPYDKNTVDPAHEMPDHPDERH